jgi:transposase
MEPIEFVTQAPSQPSRTDSHKKEDTMDSSLGKTPSEGTPTSQACAPRFVGCDLHKQQITFCILDAEGTVLQRGRIASTRQAIQAFARNELRLTDEVSMEATTNTWAVVDLVEPHVTRIVVSNPMATKAIAAAKIKTDRIDAKVLADLLRCRYLPEVWQPDPATRKLRRLTNRRSGLGGDRTAIKNRLHAVLAMRLIEVPVKDLFSPAGLAWLRSTPDFDEETRSAVDSDLRLLDATEAELKAMDLTLAKLGYSEARVKLLMTLPGVDLPVALSLLAAWGDESRFIDAAHAVSYLGLVPRTYQSDRRCYRGPITKRGNSNARWMLVQAAQHLDSHPGPLGVFFRRLLNRKNRNVAVVAAARKLALVAWHMLRNNEPYRYAQSDTTAAKLARLRVKATGERRKPATVKGQACVSKSATGGRTRTVKPLAKVYEEEGLPLPTGLKSGEVRMIEETGVRPFVETLGREQIKRKGHRRKKPVEDAQSGARKEIGSADRRAVESTAASDEKRA